MEWWLKFVPVVAIVALYLSCLYWADRDGYKRGYSKGRDDGRIEELKRRTDKPRVLFLHSEDWAMKRAAMYTLSSAITVRKVDGLEYPWYLMDENGRVLTTDNEWIVPNFDAMPKVQR